MNVNIINRKIFLMAMAALFSIFLFGTLALANDDDNSDEIIFVESEVLDTNNLNDNYEVAMAGPHHNVMNNLEFTTKESLLKAYKSEIFKNPGNIEIYRSLAESSVIFDGSPNDFIDLFRQGFNHFVHNTDDIEGITRLGMFLAGKTRTKYPNSAMRIYQTMIAKTKGKLLTDDQTDRIKYAKSWVSSH